MKLPIQAQPVLRTTRVTKIYQELTDSIAPSSDLQCCLDYERIRENCDNYEDPVQQRLCYTQNGARFQICLSRTGDDKCVKHWEDSSTVGYTCNKKSSCESISNYWRDKCWGSCEDNKIYCSKDKIGSCQNL